jgi:AcrR family transcriptional regulator
MSKLSLREQSKQDSIKRILDVSKNMILEGNYFTTTTRRIAKAANISIGLVYKYFPKGKPEIAFEICKREYSEFLKKNKFPQLTAKNIPQIIREVLKNFVQFHTERAQLIAALDIAFLSKKSNMLDFDEADILEMNPIPKILTQRYKSDSNKLMKIKKMNTILLNTIESIIHRHVNYSRIFDSDEELVDFLVYIVGQIVQYKI